MSQHKSLEKEINKNVGPHSPSDVSRIKNTYKDDDAEEEKEPDTKKSLKAMIFDESVSDSDNIVLEGIMDYARAFWKGLVGDPFGEFTALIDPKIDPKRQAFIKRMKAPFSVEEVWMIKNGYFSKKELIAYREMEAFLSLYAMDAENAAPHILPGAKEKFRYYRQILPAIKEKYDTAVEAAENALGLDHYKHRRRHYPGMPVARKPSVTVDGSGNVDGEEKFLKKNYNSLKLLMLGNIRRTIEELINYDIIAKEDKRIEQLEHMEKQLVEDAYDLKNLAKLWGTDIKPGAWRALIQKYRVIITRSRNMARIKSADNKELTVHDVDREAEEVEKREAELAAR